MPIQYFLFLVLSGLFVLATNVHADPLQLEAENGIIRSPFVSMNGFAFSPVRTLDPSASGSVTLSFSISEAGNYVTQLLIDSPTIFDVYASLDGQAPSKSFFVNPGEQTLGFEWRSLYWGATEGSNIQYLSQGNHTLVVYGGTANIKIDKVRIIKMTDLVASELVSPSTALNGNTAVMGSGLALAGQDRQGCYLLNKNFVCVIHANLNKFEMVVSLPGKLEAKRYYVFVKGSSPGGFSASVGQRSTNRVIPNSSDENGLWTALGALDVAETSSNLVVTTKRLSSSLTVREQSLLEGVYITDNPSEIVESNDIILPTNSNPILDSSPPHKGNLISNSSFEVGVMADWVLISRSDTTSQKSLFTPFSSVWDRSEGFDGTSSLVIVPNRLGSTTPSTYQILDSRAFHLKPNKKYTASAMVKASDGKTARVVMRLVNVHDATILTESVFPNISDIWKRVDVNVVTNVYPDYRIEFIVHNTSDRVWIDAVQLEEGGLSPFVHSQELEAGFEIEKLGNIFYEDEAIKANLHLHNFASDSRSKQLHFEVRNYANKLVKSGTTSVVLSAGEHRVQAFDISTGQRGIFRLVYWIDGYRDSEKEKIYSILPRPKILGPKENSFMGVHSNIGNLPLQTLQRMGIYWIRTLSAADLFRWATVEPNDDEFIWFDNSVQTITANGFSIMGSLNLETLPAWALDSQQRPRLDKWRDYVLQVVTHYKSTVKYWEIDNEPHFRLPSDFYAQMLKTAVDAIEEADPTAHIVGMGGTDYGYMTKVVTSLQTLYPSWDWKAHIDIFATHIYPSGPSVPSALTNIIEPYGIPVWNTETGVWDRGSYFGDNSGFTSRGRQIFEFRDAERYYRGAIKKPEALVQNFLSSIGGGMTKYFYYDARAADQPFGTHPTLLETDDSMRSKGIAYAIAGYFIDFSKIIGQINLPNVQAYLFEKEGIPVLTLWSSDFKNRNLSTTLSSSQYEIFDLMGNPITVQGSAIPFGRTPIYIRGRGISTNSFQSAIRNATLSDRLDVLPPQLSIVSVPRGLVSDGTMRVRWLAIDETSIPEAGDLDPEQTSSTPGANPNALLYSFRFRNSDDWSPWSAGTFTDFVATSGQNLVFQVRAKDEAGNISATASSAIVVNGANTNQPQFPKNIRIKIQ